MTQITVINKSDLLNEEESKVKNKEHHSDIKKDVQKVKKNIEEKIKKNELAKIRDQEIQNRKYSYFKDKKNTPIIEEDKTKLFYDENILKKSFLKKDQFSKEYKSEENKKKTPLKNFSEDNRTDQARENGDLISALNSPSSVMEIRESAYNEKKETLFFNEKEVELGLKQKKRIREYISTIIDEPVKIIIID